MELILFIAACMVLNFLFVTETALITYTNVLTTVYSACSQDFSFYHSATPAANRLGVRKARRGCSLESWLKITKGIFQAIQCNAQQQKEVWGEQELFGMCPLLRELLGISLLVRGGEWFYLHHFFSRLLFPSLIKLSLSWSMSFLTFALPIHSSIPLGGM